MTIRDRAWRRTLTSKKKKSEDILISPPDDNKFYRFIWVMQVLLIDHRVALAAVLGKMTNANNFRRRNRTVHVRRWRV